ncbi:hypothetical protein KC660_02540 [Candidatus Dojkabacteria bacterium]|uniref:FecR protein domain-containing protein n=1 Tax=Candidatus Dojkabacteria bacterium TaxID=2099670 RepID=A0A955L3L1_9BACT|nr:hypothetical protein [Candidatus Dojkabacteria bacterium]
MVFAGIYVLFAMVYFKVLDPSAIAKTADSVKTIKSSATNITPNVDKTKTVVETAEKSDYQLISGQLYSSTSNSAQSKKLVSKGSFLETGVALETQDENVILSSSKNGVMRLESGTEIVIDTTTGGKVDLTLNSGRLFVRTLKDSSDMMINVLNSTVTVGPGAVSMVQTSSSLTDVIAFSVGLKLEKTKTTNDYPLEKDFVYELTVDSDTDDTKSGLPLSENILVQDPFLMWNLEEENNLGVPSEQLGLLGSISLSNNEPTDEEPTDGVKIQGVQDSIKYIY